MGYIQFLDAQATVEPGPSFTHSLTVSQEMEVQTICGSSPQYISDIIIGISQQYHGLKLFLIDFMVYHVL